MDASSTLDVESLMGIARRVRGTVIDLSYGARTPHLGSSLSCVDILVAAYWHGALNLAPADPIVIERDRLVLSKGHAAIALYAALAHRGVIPMDLLKEYAKPGSLLAEQPIPGAVAGVEVATGSLGHGLSLALGKALGCRIRGFSPRFVVILSDGECNEGSVWEAAMFAPAQHLNNIAVVVDYNGWQATGRTDSIMATIPLRDKWRSFGWEAHEVDGHDIHGLQRHLGVLPTRSGKPLALIARTTKGRGVSFMEDDNNWHYRIPSADERHKAHAELGLL